MTVESGEQEMVHKPLNPRVKINRRGMPYVELADLVASVLKLPVMDVSVVPARIRGPQEMKDAAISAIHAVAENQGKPEGI